MAAVFLRIVNMSISAGWIVAAVILIRALLKKSPKALRCILWAIVAIRLIIPFSFESEWSLMPSSETIPETIITADEPRIHSGIPVINQAVNPIIEDKLAPEAGNDTTPIESIINVLSAVWIAGVLIMLAYLGISYIRIKKRVNITAPLDTKVYICDDIDTPFILGLINAKIFIPSSLNEEQMLYVLAHEKAHVKRGDHWWKPIGFILLSIHWFNPLMWAAYILLCRDIELACDERVIEKMNNTDKAAYSNTLLICSVSKKMITACPIAFGEVGVKERIKSILNYKKPAFWVIGLALVVCFILGVCFLTDPISSITDPFGQDYYFFRTVYCYPAYSVVYEPVSSPVVMLTADKHLVIYENGHPEAGDVVDLGEMQEIDISRRNFDLLFSKSGKDGSEWYWPTNAYKIRKDAQRAWMVDSDQRFYYLIQGTKNLYLAYGESGIASNGNNTSDNLYFSWMMLLNKKVDDGIIRTCVLENDMIALYRDGEIYLNPYIPEDKLPDGFEFAGTIVDDTGIANAFDGCKCYVNPDLPDVIYVYQECGVPISEDTVDTTRTQWAYVKWFLHDSLVYGELGNNLNVGINGNDLIVGRRYITVDCVYMNPLSSSFPGNDSGKVYQVLQNDFLIMDKDTAYGEFTEDLHMDTGWIWQEFPFTDEEWNDLFIERNATTYQYKINEVFNKILYQSLPNGWFILWLDGNLWLVETRDNNKAGKFIWSIFEIVPENSVDSMQWLYAPTLSSRYPALKIRIDSGFQSAHVFCDDGRFMIPNIYQINDEITNYTFPDSNSSVYWSPTTKKYGSVMQDTRIYLSATDKDGRGIDAELYITAENASLGVIYTVSLISKDLNMEMDEYGEGLIIGSAK